MKYHFFKHFFEYLWDILFPYEDGRNPLLADDALLPVRITTHLLHTTIGKNTYSLVALSDYSDHSVANLIHAFKYHRDARAIRVLGAALGDYLLESLTRRRELYPADSFIITTIPLAKKRYKERGFNQMNVLLTEVAREYPGLSKYMQTELLFKKRDTPSQTHLSRKERLSNVRDAFSCTQTISGEVFLLDDVATTGATVLEASKVLSTAGATSVTIVTLARRVR